MRFALIDYQPSGEQINRDQTGTYGSNMTSGGLCGRLLGLVKRKGIRLPVISFSYAAALLRSQGHQVDIVTGDLTYECDVAIFATVMYYCEQDIIYLKGLRQRWPSLLIGVIGGFSQSVPDFYKNSVDFNIAGDIESAIYAFFNGTWDWRGKFDGGVESSLEDLPLPDWSGFPVATYNYRPVLSTTPFLTAQTSRGCAFGCKFCPYIAVQGRKMRFRPLQSVEDEVRNNVRQFGIRSLLFRDIFFTAQRERTLELCERLQYAAPELSWACETHVNALDEALIAKMAVSGLRAINLGVESADNEVLTQTGKAGINNDKLGNVIRWLHERNIRVQAFYIFGLLDDTPESMERTFQLACRLNTFTAQFCVATPFPGTPFMAENETLLLHKDWKRYTEYQPVMRLKHSTSHDVLNARDRAFSRYYLRYGWMRRYGLQVVRQFLGL